MPGSLWKKTVSIRFRESSWLSGLAARRMHRTTRANFRAENKIPPHRIKPPIETHQITRF